MIAGASTSTDAGGGKRGGGAHRLVREDLKVRDAVGGTALAVTAAVAYPLLGLLSSNVEFFVARQGPPADVLVFVLGVALGVPAVIALVVAGALKVSPRAGKVLAAVVLGAFLTVVVVPVVERFGPLPVGVTLAVAGVAGAALAAALLAFEPLRTLQRWGMVVPVLVAAMVLFASPVSGIVLPARAVSTGGVTIGNPAPVVLLVLDELPLSSLLTAEGDVDRVRYPNFARLQDGFTWHRNTTSTHAHTHQALPAMLSGGAWKPDAEPVADEYPRNLFTLLGGAYRDVVAREQVTWLCPEAICETRQPAFPQRFGALLSDSWIVAQHVVLPDALTRHLPPVDQGWTDFAGATRADEDAVPADDEPSAEDLGHGPFTRLYRSAPPTQATWPEFLASFTEGSGPRLRYFHAMSPHHPFRWLPGPTSYAVDPGRWYEGEWGREQFHQRHLLQLGAADAALGDLLDTLESSGWYDEALIAVVADHGVAFPEEQHFRFPTGDNLDGLAWVPFFLKQPGQTSGRIDDRPATLRDVLPTVADALDVDGLWPQEGLSLLADEVPADRSRSFTSLEGETWSLPATAAGQRQLVQDKLELFGAEDGWEGVYHYGPHRDLVGTPVDALPTVPSTGAADVVDADAYREVDSSASELPALIRGRVSGVDVDAGDWFAVELNGRIAAVGPAHGTAEGNPSFSAIVPPDAFVDGDNGLAVHRIVDTGGDLALQPLSG